MRSPLLEQAASIFDSFVQKAGGQAEFAEAVKRSKDRAQDIRDTVKFIKEGQTDAAIEAARQEKDAGQPAGERETRPPRARARLRAPANPPPAGGARMHPGAAEP